MELLILDGSKIYKHENVNINLSMCSSQHVHVPHHASADPRAFGVRQADGLSGVFALFILAVVVRLAESSFRTFSTSSESEGREESEAQDDELEDPHRFDTCSTLTVGCLTKQ